MLGTFARYTADLSLIRRYDNAPHFPELDNFPHRMHYPDLVEPFIKIGVVDLLEIVESGM